MNGGSGKNQKMLIGLTRFGSGEVQLFFAALAADPNAAIPGRCHGSGLSAGPMAGSASNPE
jgi:hypothetical protein